MTILCCIPFPWGSKKNKGPESIPSKGRYQASNAQPKATPLSPPNQSSLEENSIQNHTISIGQKKPSAWQRFKDWIRSMWGKKDVILEMDSVNITEVTTTPPVAPCGLSYKEEEPVKDFPVEQICDQKLEFSEVEAKPPLIAFEKVLMRYQDQEVLVYQKDPIKPPEIEEGSSQFEILCKEKELKRLNEAREPEQEANGQPKPEIKSESDSMASGGKEEQKKPPEKTPLLSNSKIDDTIRCPKLQLLFMRELEELKNYLTYTEKAFEEFKKSSLDEHIVETISEEDLNHYKTKTSYLIDLVEKSNDMYNDIYLDKNLPSAELVEESRKRKIRLCEILNQNLSFLNSIPEKKNLFQKLSGEKERLSHALIKDERNLSNLKEELKKEKDKEANLKALEIPETDTTQLSKEEEKIQGDKKVERMAAKREIEANVRAIEKAIKTCQNRIDGFKDQEMSEDFRLLTKWKEEVIKRESAMQTISLIKKIPSLLDQWKKIKVHAEDARKENCDIFTNFNKEIVKIAENEENIRSSTTGSPHADLPTYMKDTALRVVSSFFPREKLKLGKLLNMCIEQTTFDKLYSSSDFKVFLKGYEALSEEVSALMSNEDSRKSVEKAKTVLPENLQEESEYLEGIGDLFAVPMSKDYAQFFSPDERRELKNAVSRMQKEISNIFASKCDELILKKISLEELQECSKNIETLRELVSPYEDGTKAGENNLSFMNTLVEKKIIFDKNTQELFLTEEELCEARKIKKSEQTKSDNLEKTANGKKKLIDLAYINCDEKDPEYCGHILKLNEETHEKLYPIKDRVNKIKKKIKTLKARINTIKEDLPPTGEGLKILEKAVERVKESKGEGTELVMTLLPQLITQWKSVSLYAQDAQKENLKSFETFSKSIADLSKQIKKPEEKMISEKLNSSYIITGTFQERMFLTRDPSFKALNITHKNVVKEVLETMPD